MTGQWWKLQFLVHALRYMTCCKNRLTSSSTSKHKLFVFLSIYTTFVFFELDSQGSVNCFPLTHFEQLMNLCFSWGSTLISSNALPPYLSAWLFIFPVTDILKMINQCQQTVLCLDKLWKIWLSVSWQALKLHPAGHQYNMRKSVQSEFQGCSPGGN